MYTRGCQPWKVFGWNPSRLRMLQCDADPSEFSQEARGKMVAAASQTGPAAFAVVIRRNCSSLPVKQMLLFRCLRHRTASSLLATYQSPAVSHSSLASVFAPRTMSTTTTNTNGHTPVDVLLIGLGSIGSVYAYMLERVGASGAMYSPFPYSVYSHALHLVHPPDHDAGAPD
jgi:hypothetical protein